MNPYTLLGEFAGLVKFLLEAERLFPDQVKLSENIRHSLQQTVTGYDQFMEETVKKAEAVEVTSCQPNS